MLFRFVLLTGIHWLNCPVYNHHNSLSKLVDCYIVRQPIHRYKHSTDLICYLVDKCHYFHNTRCRDYLSQGISGNRPNWPVRINICGRIVNLVQNLLPDNYHHSTELCNCKMVAVLSGDKCHHYRTRNYHMALTRWSPYCHQIDIVCHSSRIHNCTLDYQNGLYTAHGHCRSPRKYS